MDLIWKAPRSFFAGANHAGRLELSKVPPHARQQYKQALSVATDDEEHLPGNNTGAQLLLQDSPEQFGPRKRTVRLGSGNDAINMDTEGDLENRLND